MRTDPDAKAIAGKIKELRKLHGLKQREICGAIGMSQGAYSNYENCSRVPGADAIGKIADYYGLTVEEFYDLSIDLDAETEDFSKEPRSEAVLKEEDFENYVRLLESNGLNIQESDLLASFSRLSTSDRRELIKYARFLQRKKMTENPIIGRI